MESVILLKPIIGHTDIITIKASNNYLKVKYYFYYFFWRRRVEKNRVKLYFEKVTILLLLFACILNRLDYLTDYHYLSAEVLKRSIQTRMGYTCIRVYLSS